MDQEFRQWRRRFWLSLDDDSKGDVDDDDDDNGDDDDDDDDYENDEGDINENKNFIEKKFEEKS